MRAAVLVESSPSSALRVAGLTPVLRSVLGLGKVGAESVTIVGTEAVAWVEAVKGDDRLAVEVLADTAIPSGTEVLVRGEAVLDVKALRTLVELRNGAVVRNGVVLAVARTTGFDPEHPWQHTASMLGEAGAGVAVLVSDAEGARVAEDALLQSLRKPQDGVVSRNLNRHLSLALTRHLARMGLRPNQVSVGILAIGLLGAGLAATGTYGAMALGGVLFQAQSVLDGCDGELSRLSFRGSKMGEWIDTVGDDVTNYSFFAGAAAGLVRAGVGTLPMVLGAVGLTAGVVCSLIEYRYLLAIGSGDLNKYPLGFGNDFDGPAPEEKGLAKIAGLMRPMFKRDFFVFATMVACFLGARAVLVMLALFAGGAVLTLSAVLRSEWSRGFRLPPRG